MSPTIFLGRLNRQTRGRCGCIFALLRLPSNKLRGRGPDRCLAEALANHFLDENETPLDDLAAEALKLAGIAQHWIGLSRDDNERLLQIKT